MHLFCLYLSLCFTWITVFAAGVLLNIIPGEIVPIRLHYLLFYLRRNSNSVFVCMTLPVVYLG